MADLLDFGGVRVLTSNAAPGAGYVARFYESGTTTPKTVYTDSTLSTAHGTSVTADAAGVFAAVWSSGGSIKCVIETDAGAVVQTIDPVISVSATSSGAEDISFTPTVDLPFTNVQDAIEGAAASAASGFATYGIGITGNATLLANLDATNIGAGAYRFDNTTTGTYPTGVAAADTGLVDHWRQAAGTAMQVLYHATSDRVFHRRMASAAWGTWRENIEVNQGAAEGDTIYRGPSAWTRLAKGTASQVLRMNSGATAPEWGAPPGWTLVSSSSTWTGGEQTITGLGGYSKVMITGSRLIADTADFRALRVGTSGGLITTSIYGVVSGLQNRLEMSSSNTIERSFSCIIERFNTTDAAKPVIASAGPADSSKPTHILSASAFDRIQVANATGNITSGALYVWGQA